MDMLNHRRDGTSNAIVDQNKNGSYGCYAKRDIKAGEEVGLPYLANQFYHNAQIASSVVLAPN